MIKITFTLIALACLSLSVFAQDYYSRNTSVDIKNYDFVIEISELNDTIIGVTTIQLVVKQPIQELVLDLHNVNKEGKGMMVNDVYLDNKLVDFKQQEEQLIIKNAFDKNNKEIQIFYRGVPQDGLIISENKFGDRTFFCDNWPNRAHHYIPVIDHPYEKATSSFSIVAPLRYQIVSNGTLKESTNLQNGKRKTQWVSEQELPTKVIVFGAAEFAMEKSGTVGAIPVYSWVYPQERKNGFYDYALAVEILDWFENKIAPYPYQQLSNVQSKTRYGGMENAGCIFYHENSIDGNRGSEDLFAHEIAHQWFGNSASEADWHHVWLSEGFATYLTEVYKQETKGEEAFQKGMLKAKQRVLAFEKKYPGTATIDTSIVNLNQLLSPMTYQRAAWILHTLRGVVGEDAFWNGVRNYYNKFEYSNAMSNDLKEELEKASGKDLGLFFNQWLYQPGMVKMEMNWKYNEKKKELTIELVQPKGNWFVCPAQFKIEFEGNMPAYITKVKVIDEYRTSLIIPLEDAPKSIEFDPYNNILRY
ncbi:MAG: M1 family metallopeptidase [Salibacteraceae bacterium]